MSSRLYRFAAVALSVALLMLAAIGCAGTAEPAPPAPTTAPATTPGEKPTTAPAELVAEPFEWPERLHIYGHGQSGLVKYVSWVSIMMGDTGMQIRVVPEEEASSMYEKVRDGEGFLCAASKSAFRNSVEAIEDKASKDGGGWQARIVWVHDLANSGFYVRGDSDIQTIYDIGKGTRIAVWNMSYSTLNPPRSLLAWLQVPEEDILWINAGSFEGAQRAVAEGRADVVFCFPTSVHVYESSSAPHGIRFLDLNSDADPEGARRWQDRNPLYTFGPILSGVPEARGHWGTQGYIFNITREQADPELVYQFAKWLDENYDLYKDTHDSNQYMTLDHLMEALKTTYIPVHEGLIRYLEEKGLWTAAHDARQQENIDALQVYIDGFSDAIAQAEAQGIEVMPTNREWLAFWEGYKVEQAIPKVAMHINITERGTVIVPTEVALPEPPPPPPAVPDKPAYEGDVAVEIISIEPEVLRVENEITINVKSVPGAELTLELYLITSDQKSGFPKDPVHIADENGETVWNWLLFKHSYGLIEFKVTATKDGKTGVYTTHGEIKH